MMTIAFAIVLVLHGLIHLIGAVKVFGVADLPQLTQPISPVFGVVWLVAAVLCLAAAASLFLWPRGWWMVGAAALILSVIAIVSSWPDARFGLIPNGMLFVGVVSGFFRT